MAESIICWDFDHTLFGYQRTIRGTSPAPRYGEFAGFGVRQGIEPVLARLARLLATNDITTSGSISYVTRALEATGASGILRSVARIFPGSEIATGAGKLYQPVARFHGLALEETSSRMLVIGDLPDDAPADLARVVFIRQPNGHLHDPTVVEAVIGILCESGNADFYRGFQTLYDQARRSGQRIPYGGPLLITEGTTAICVDEQPPGPARLARLGTVPTPTITLLDLS